MSVQLNRTSVQIYRDCLRLIKHVAGESRKGDAMRMMVRSEFKKNMTEKNPEMIAMMKENAVQGLTNYLVTHNLSRMKRKETPSYKATAKIDPADASFGASKAAEEDTPKPLTVPADQTEEGQAATQSMSSLLTSLSSNNGAKDKATKMPSATGNVYHVKPVGSGKTKEEKIEESPAVTMIQNAMKRRMEELKEDAEKTAEGMTEQEKEQLVADAEKDLDREIEQLEKQKLDAEKKIAN